MVSPPLPPCYAARWLRRTQFQGASYDEAPRPYYPTKSAASADIPHLKDKHHATGAGSSGILSRTQVAEFEEAKTLVPEVNLAELARFWRLYHPLSTVSRVRELIPRMLSGMETRLGKTRHYEEIDSRLGIFAKKFGDRLPQTLTREELLNYLLNIESKGRTILNHKRALVNFLNWMTEQRPQIISVNPLAGVKKRQLPKLDTKEITFLSIEASRRYLRACERYDHELVAHEVIQLFSGVRADDEMADFDGQWVKPSTREITIPAEIAKMDRREVISGLEDNFWKWWAAYGRTGLLRPKNHGPRWLRLRVLAEVGEQARADQLAALPLKTLLARDDAKALLKQWPWNARRRTFCTYHVAKHQNADRTALILRHRGEASTLHNSYRGLGVTQAEGVEFFELEPTKGTVRIAPARPAKGIVRLQDEKKISAKT